VLLVSHSEYRLLHFDVNLIAPGPVGNVEGYCSVVVWSQPAFFHYIAFLRSTW